MLGPISTMTVTVYTLKRGTPHCRFKEVIYKSCSACSAIGTFALNIRQTSPHMLISHDTNISLREPPNTEKAIERRSCQYGFLPHFKGATDTVETRVNTGRKHVLQFGFIPLHCTLRWGDSTIKLNSTVRIAAKHNCETKLAIRRDCHLQDCR